MNPEVNISELVPQLLEALRHELYEYGELLALLEHQQEQVTRRVADEVLHSAAAISDQANRVQEARRRREGCQRAAAQVLQKSEETSFAALLPMIPGPYRFAVTELVRENNDLLVRVQQRARQNHMLLRHSLELMQRFIGSLTAANQPTTYTGSRTLQANSAPPPPIYQAVG